MVIEAPLVWGERERERAWYSWGEWSTNCSSFDQFRQGFFLIPAGGMHMPMFTFIFISQKVKRQKAEYSHHTPAPTFSTHKELPFAFPYSNMIFKGGSERIKESTISVSQVESKFGTFSKGSSKDIFSS